MTWADGQDAVFTAGSGGASLTLGQGANGRAIFSSPVLTESLGYFGRGVVRSGRTSMNRTQGVLGRIQKGFAKPAYYRQLFIGDSWTVNDSWTQTLRRTLRNKYKNGGPGYITLTGVQDPAEGSVTTVGKWLVRSGVAAVAGIDATDTTSSTPGDTQTVVQVATSFVIHYHECPVLSISFKIS